MEPLQFKPLSRVAVSGGTHGNELCGVYMLKEQKAQWDRFGSFSLTTVLANPRAVEVCRRYTETDLNRCFTAALLSAPITEDTPYEVRRAQELNGLLGPRGSEKSMDLVCDLHNTTANVGLCILANASDWVAFHLYKYLQEKITSAPVRLVIIDKPPSGGVFSLESLGKHGFTIEVGPQPHGVLRAEAYNLMSEAVDRALEWTESFNTGTVFEGGKIEAYFYMGKKDYPRDPKTQEITAAIHPQLQDNDFALLKPGDPAFMSFSGETICYEGKETYPFFVNEAAYYEKHTAFALARRETLLLPTISVKGQQQ